MFCIKETAVVTALGKEVITLDIQVATLLGTCAKVTVCTAVVDNVVTVLDTGTEVRMLDTDVTLLSTEVTVVGNDFTKLDVGMKAREITALESEVAAKELETDLALVKLVDADITEDGGMTLTMPTSLFCGSRIERSN